MERSLECLDLKRKWPFAEVLTPDSLPIRKLIEEAAQTLYEARMTYDQLFRVSEPKRVLRSRTVRGPALDINAYQDSLYWYFNFKSFPSTTGLRHKGYIKFLKPKYGANKKTMEKVEAIADCQCPDYKYRWSWSNKQRGSGVVGANSLNQAWNRAPRITNPQGRPGLCKHLLALRDYIYGAVSKWPGDEPDVPERMNKLVAQSQKRWVNYKGEIEKAKDRQSAIVARKVMRQRGITPYRAPVGFGIQPKIKPTKPEAPAEERSDVNDMRRGNVRPTPLPGEEGITGFESLNKSNKSGAGTSKSGAVFICEMKNNLTDLLEEIEDAAKAEAAPDKSPSDQALELLGELPKITALLQQLTGEEEAEPAEDEGGEPLEPTGAEGEQVDLPPESPEIPQGA